MPKTRDAFAFRDFDKERILQRPYFKNFGFNADLTDAEILQSLQVQETDSVDDMEKKLSTIKALHEREKKFSDWIGRHERRYEKIGRLMLIARNIDPETNFIALSPMEYTYAINGANKLWDHLFKMYTESEKMIQKRYREKFTDNIRKYRKAAGLTQKELGELVQVSPMGMSHYARGERDMPTHTLIRISKVLNVSADKLLGLT